MNSEESTTLGFLDALAHHDQIAYTYNLLLITIYSILVFTLKNAFFSIQAATGFHFKTEYELQQTFKQISTSD